jgi:hypothetical protein
LLSLNETIIIQRGTAIKINKTKYERELKEDRL